MTSAPPNRRDWDAIVVGLGAIGSGAAYWLARERGDRVLGLEFRDLYLAEGAEVLCEAFDLAELLPQFRR